MTTTRNDWEQRFQSLTIEARAFINGEYRPAISGDTFECLSPVDGRFLASVASTDEADANLAVEVARQSFESGVWAHKAPAERKRILIRFADLILQHQEELALLETLDMGKPISDSMSIDIPATANAIRWSAEAIDKIYDEVAATPHDQLGWITREPTGVVAAIVPWNFPLIMASWKFAPALAAGNSFILKPSEKSPLMAGRYSPLMNARASMARDWKRCSQSLRVVVIVVARQGGIGGVVWLRCLAWDGCPHPSPLPEVEGTDWGLLRISADLKNLCRIHNRLDRSGRRIYRYNPVSPLSLRERDRVRGF